MANDEHPRTGSGHPIPTAVARARAEIASVADTPTWSMTPLDVRETVTPPDPRAGPTTRSSSPA